MIKVKVNNEYKDVVKIFCGGTLQKEIIKVWSREAQEYVYESSVEHTGTLPITINANGDALLDYRIYGADGGVGEATENLFDIRKVNQPPICTYSGSVFSLHDQGVNYDIMCKTNGIGATPIPEKMIAVSPGTYTLIFGNGTTAPNACRFSVRLFDGETVAFPVNQIFINPSSRTFVIENDGYLSFMINLGDVTIADFMLVKGSTASTNYIPYGYKLPMTVSDGNTEQTVPVYIGENQLDAGEYVSYGEQKIYKRTDNLFMLLDDMKDAKNWELVMSVYEAYFIYYHFSPEQLTYLKNVGTVYGKAFKKEGGQYIPRTVLAITKKKLSSGVTDDMRLIYSNGITVNYIHDFTQDVDAYLCIGYGPGITEETKQFFVDAILNNFDIMLSSTAPVEYIPYLQPTDPPVPLPQIPTIDGTTVIDYDGDPKPSQMYVKYRR